MRCEWPTNTDRHGGALLVGQKIHIRAAQDLVINILKDIDEDGVETV
jgi:hypothetical protein